MSDFHPIYDTLLAIASYGLTASLTVYLVFRTNLTEAPRNTAVVVRIASRLGIVFALGLACCYCIDVPYSTFLLILAIVWWALFSLDIHAITQPFVFGFPEFVLHPRPGLNVKKSLQHTSERSSQSIHGDDLAQFEEQMLITHCPLRPFGEVRIAGLTLGAFSENGSYIESSVTVKVVGTRNGNLIVKEVSLRNPEE